MTESIDNLCSKEHIERSNTLQAKLLEAKNIHDQICQTRRGRRYSRRALTVAIEQKEDLAVLISPKVTRSYISNRLPRATSCF